MSAGACSCGDPEGNAREWSRSWPRKSLSAGVGVGLLMSPLRSSGAVILYAMTIVTTAPFFGRGARVRVSAGTTLYVAIARVWRLGSPLRKANLKP